MENADIPAPTLRSARTLQEESRDQFEAAMAAAGLEVPPAGIVADGRLHICSASGKGGEGGGAYAFYGAGIPAGGFENWRDGRRWRAWHARLGPFRPADVAEHRIRVRDMRAQRKAAEAEEIIKDASEPPKDHRFLANKQIGAHGLLYSETPIAISPWRYSKPGVLIIPIRDIDGILHNVQLIDADCNKDFLLNGCKKGCFHVLGKDGAAYTRSGLRPDGLNIICVGYATGWSCFKAMDVPVVVAFDANNLEAVARALHGQYPKARFLIAGDDDFCTPGNPGKKGAEEAARAIDAEVAFPVFHPGRVRENGWTDFNDLAVAAGEGYGAVRDCLEAAETVEKREEQEAISVDEALVARIEARVLHLAALPETAYETVKDAEAKALRIRVGYLDRRVKEGRKSAECAKAATMEKSALVHTLEPWPEAVDGDCLLRELCAAVQRQVVMTEAQQLLCALWVLHSHTHDLWQHSPILAFRSPEPGCGKTTALKVLRLLTPDSLMASSVSSSAVFRFIDRYHPTLLCDEQDTALKDNHELRHIFNAGHDRQGAFVMRSQRVGKSLETLTFSVWAPKAIALIGELPPTLRTRSFVIPLRRKLPSEIVEGVQGHEMEIENVGRKCARWGMDNMAQLKGSLPAIPAPLSNRDADNVVPLLAIAEKIGGEWPEKARMAALAVIEGAKPSAEADSPGIRLLADCRTVFRKCRFKQGEPEALTMANLITALCSLEESPWRTYNRGRPITGEQVGKLLRPYGIHSEARREKGKRERRRRWYKERFEDAWKRYLPREDGEDAG